jgi:hypothetical protein
VEKMKNKKTNYETPKLTIHGTVESLTLQGGSGFADASIGIGDPVTTSNSASHP